MLLDLHVVISFLSALGVAKTTNYSGYLFDIDKKRREGAATLLEAEGIFDILHYLQSQGLLSAGNKTKGSELNHTENCMR